MADETASIVKVEDLQSGENINLLGLLDIGIFDIVVHFVVFISLIFIFLAFLKMSKNKKSSPYRYLAIGIGIYIIAVIIPTIIFLITYISPGIIDAYENEIGTIHMYIYYITGFFSATFLLIGALKLRKHANALYQGG